MRTRVALELGWEPIVELRDEIHDGDRLVRADWPWRWWGLEPLDRRRADWETRYSAAFRIGRPAPRREYRAGRSVVGRAGDRLNGKPKGATSTMLMTPSATDELDIVERLLTDRPSFHMGGSAHWASLPETLQAIHSSVGPGDVTLETGVGASTVVFAAGGRQPHGDQPRRLASTSWCGTIAGGSVSTTASLTFIADCSEDVLPTLLSRERTLDVAFIDGAHSFPFAEVDWCYITRSLKLGAKLILDDINIPSVEPVFRHMSLEPNWRLRRHARQPRGGVHAARIPHDRTTSGPPSG